MKLILQGVISADINAIQKGIENVLFSSKLNRINW